MEELVPKSNLERIDTLIEIVGVGHSQALELIKSLEYYRHTGEYVLDTLKKLRSDLTPPT